MNVYCKAAFAVAAMVAAAGVAPLAGQSIQATVTNIPASATRLVFVVDGSGITSPSPSVRNIVQGTSSVALYLGVPGGASYRVRVVATDGAVNLLSSGKVTNISVPAGQSVPVTVVLSAVQVTSDASTPGGAGNGTPVTLKFNIADAGSSLKTGSDWCWIDYGTNSSSLSNRAFGDMTAGGDGEVQCSIPLVTPGAGSVLYYRFSTYAQEFLYDHDDPLLAWPSASPATMTLTASNTIGLTISGIPVSASRVVILVDGGSLPEPAAAAQSTGGATTLHVTFGVMAGSPYRVRVIAHDAGSKLLSSGMATGITVTAGASAPVSLTLSDMPVQSDPSTPAAAVAGSQVTVKANITDSGSSLKTGLSQCWIDYGTVSSSLSNRKYGDISRLGGGVDQCMVTLTAPSAGSTLYYRFATYAYEFIYDRISPLLVWPASTPNAISLTGAGAISLSVTNIPSAATRLVAVADNGGVSPVALMAQPQTGGTSSTQMTFHIPAGGPYRVRIIAHDAAAAVLSSGMASGITVSAGGSAAASVSLAPVTVALDPSTPATATPGSSITLRFNVTDSGNFIKAGYGYCWIDYSGDPANLSESVFGTVSTAGGGSSQCAVSLTLPSSGSVFYYQLGAIGYDFISDQVTPLLEWPTGSALQMSLLTYTPTITTAPEGLSIVVDGVSYTAPRTFTWASGSTHTIAVASPQTGGGTRYWFSNWSDGGAISHTVTAPCLAVLQANFTALFPGSTTDFNNDGQSDLLWRNYTTGENLVWYMNGVTKTGEAALRTLPDVNWVFVGTGDLNGDGRTDILWRNYATGQNLVWYMNGITWIGEASLTTVTDLNWRIVGTGDFNGDGKVDLLWRNTATGQNRVWYMDGITQIGEAFLTTITDQNWKIMGTGDFNGDGKVDILWRNTTAGVNAVWYMDGVTWTAEAFLLTVADQNWKIAGTGDFNSDGKVDILWRNTATGQNAVWRMNGVSWIGESFLPTITDMTWMLGTMAPATPPAAPVDTLPPTLAIVSHADGQTVSAASITISGTATDSGRGDSGISTVTVNGTAASGGSATGTATANWSATVALTPGQNMITVVAKDGSPAQNSTTQVIKLTRGSSIMDFNGDGKADILWRNYATGVNAVWRMNGVSWIGESFLTTVTDLNWKIVGTGDFNGDGKVDILWRNTATGQNRVWYMNGVTCTGEAFLTTITDQNWKIVGTGDFNGDGKVDLLWRNTATGVNAVWYMNGVTWTAEAFLLTVADQNWKVAGTGDFNNDGKVDILWRNTATGQNKVWYMNGVTGTGEAFLTTIDDQNWQIAGTGDYNGDGKVDLLWRNRVTGVNSVWYMDGVTWTGEAFLITVADQNWKIAMGGQ